MSPQRAGPTLAPIQGPGMAPPRHRRPTLAATTQGLGEAGGVRELEGRAGTAEPASVKQGSLCLSSHY